MIGLHQVNRARRLIAKFPGWAQLRRFATGHLRRSLHEVVNNSGLWVRFLFARALLRRLVDIRDLAWAYIAHAGSVVAAIEPAESSWNGSFHNW
jgi:hypothetical protein